MRVEDGGGAYVRIVLSRRNLMSLLAKLDGHPKVSFKSIQRDDYIVSAEEDEEPGQWSAKRRLL